MSIFATKPSSQEGGYTEEQKKQIHIKRLRLKRIWILEKLKKAKDDHSKAIFKDCIDELDKQIKGTDDCKRTNRQT